jgi:hypothetical protein
MLGKKTRVYKMSDKMNFNIRCQRFFSKKLQGDVVVVAMMVFKYFSNQENDGVTIFALIYHGFSIFHPKFKQK